MNSINSSVLSNKKNLEDFQDVKKAIYLLESPWSVNFNYIFELIKNNINELDEEILSRLRTWVISKADFLMKSCVWLLEWIEEVLNLLNIEEMFLSDEVVKFIEEIYPRLSYWTIIEMSPTQRWINWINELDYFWCRSYVEKYGKEYNRTLYTKELLLSRGFEEVELSDDFIGKIWEVRELLVYIHVNSRKNENVLSEVKKWVSWILSLSMSK